MASTTVPAGTRPEPAASASRQVRLTSDRIEAAFSILDGERDRLHALSFAVLQQIERAGGDNVDLVARTLAEMLNDGLGDLQHVIDARECLGLPGRAPARFG